ncbi:MAG: hypothetical protein Q7U64_06335, partial [Desulfocapsaceae bacterium]|nr:hypothetical protein [Desulfocapsaceae bacterium]
QGRDNPCSMRHICQMTIPGKGHKDITATKQNQGNNIGIHLFHTPHPSINNHQTKATNGYFEQSGLMLKGTI